MSMDQFNLTPTPALLELLGKIPFRGWQCVAELIDNSIDAIINNHNKLDESQKIISVTIPTKGKIQANQPLVIEDWGVGMNEQQLENAMRAGYSSKNTLSSLGLFGMGFNVATSRLANTVQVWTATEEMEHEIGVCIDLQEMKRTGSFYRPRMERGKSIHKKSGTRIEIYDYKPEATSLLQPKTIEKELARAYSERIFNEYGIRIVVTQSEIKPFKFCIWDKSRSVKYKYDDVPTYIEINGHLRDEMFCENCFSWIGNVVDTPLSIECDNCHSSERIVVKQISISGWVGIQRYSDTEHYGIDISRNGRILSKLDKSFFYWDDERGKDDSRFNPEYPRDTTYAGGRIVGQIEANFVIPKYTKDDFERDDKNWRQALHFLRGVMPLQPDLAGLFGYQQPNKSPIGRLFSAYRKINIPGTKTLVFAKDDGNCDHVTPRAWATLFYEGNPEYQDDSKWWEAVSRSELKEAPSTFNPASLTNNQNQPARTQVPTLTSPSPEKYPGKKISKRAVRFDIENLIGEKPIELTLMDYYPEIDVPSPVILEPQGSSMKFNVYLNNYHPLFRDFADGYEDLVFMEVASIYAQLKNKPDEWQITRIYYELKSKYAANTMLSVSNLVNSANKLMRDIQNKLLAGDGISMPRKPNLNAGDMQALRTNYLDREGKSIQDLDALMKSTKFLKYLDLNYLFKFVEDFPDIIYDGKILNLPFEDLDEDSKSYQAKKYSGYFSDVRWFMNDLSREGDEAIKKMKQQIIRNRFSIEILNGSFNR